MDAQRTETGTYLSRPAYDNKEAITDPQEALELLVNPWQGRWAGAYLHTGTFNEGKPYVEVHFEGREYGGGSSRRYQVDPACFKNIQDNRWATGVPMLGYTDNEKLKISDSGIRQLGQWQTEKEKAAHKLLIPGEHGWSSIFQYRGLHRLRRGGAEGWKKGHVFSSIMGKHFIVFLDEGLVEEIKEEEFA